MEHAPGRDPYCATLQARAGSRAEQRGPACPRLPPRPQRRACSRSGTVVNHDALDGRKVLAKDRVDGRHEVELLVTGGDHDSDHRPPNVLFARWRAHG